jgi:phosphatidylglycerophosphate synthase/putative flippase GtrA
MGELLDIVLGRLTTSQRIWTAAAPALLFIAYFGLGYLVYLARNGLKGKFVDHEVASRGSSFLLNMGLRQYFAWITQPIWFLLRVSGLPANAMTTLSVLLAGGAAMAISQGRFALGGWLYVASGLCDFFDGRIARTTGTASPAGAALDSVLDRLSDGVVLLGLVWYYRDSWVMPVAGVALIGSFLVSYVRAKAEALGVQMSKVGMMQRPERVAYLGLAVALSPILAALYVPSDPRPPHHLAIVAIVMIAAGTMQTATARLLYLLRALGGFSPSNYVGAGRGSVWRFGLSSAVATACDFVVMALLVQYYDVSAMTATAIGCIVGGIINFVINRSWAFGHPQPIMAQGSRYALISGTSALLNAGGVAVLLLLPSLDYRAAWLIARAAVALFWNYPLNRDYAFCPPTPPVDAKSKRADDVLRPAIDAGQGRS